MEKNFRTFLEEKMKERGLTLRKLSEVSGIALDQLERLTDERFSELPSAPYVRGYLGRLGGILGFDGSSWWDYFKDSGLLRTSGLRDELTRNRFAARPLGPYLLVAAAILLVATYGLFRFRDVIGEPTIDLSSPAQATTLTDLSSIVVSGVAQNTTALFLNGEGVPLGSDGRFDISLPLERGLNTFELKATKFLGGTTLLVRQVLSEPPERSTTTPF